LEMTPPEKGRPNPAASAWECINMTRVGSSS
jgi:hypothetical protein